MQTSGKQFQRLMKNVAEGLKTCGVEELNTAINGAIAGGSKNERRDEVDFVINMITDSYGLSKRTFKVTRAMGKLIEARRIAYCLLHYELNLSSRYIARRVFGHKAHYKVWEAINSFNTLNDKVKEDRLFKEKYDVYHAKLSEFIKSRQ